MKGKKPLPTEVKRRRGTLQASRSNSNEPTVAAEVPACPQALKGEARKEWYRAGEELDRAGIVGQIDRAALMNYCEAWAHWRTAEEEVAKTGMMATGKDGLPKINPALRECERWMVLLKGFLVEFGMTPSSRTRVSAAPKTAEKDSLEKLIDANREAFKG